MRFHGHLDDLEALPTATRRKEGKWNLGNAEKPAGKVPEPNKDTGREKRAVTLGREAISSPA
jgi:hypothetical protein